jgi:hypothetical protein
MTQIEFNMHRLFTDIALIVSRLTRVYKVCVHDKELKENIETTLQEARGLHQMIYPYASMLDNKEDISIDVKLVIADIVSGGVSWTHEVKANFCMYFSKKNSSITV